MTSATTKQVYTTGGNEREAVPSYLTLRRAHLWLAEPLRRMRLLAALADGTANYDGGALAGMTWAYTKCGDPLTRAYVTRILHQVRTPGVHWVLSCRKLYKCTQLSRATVTEPSLFTCSQHRVISHTRTHS